MRRVSILVAMLLLVFASVGLAQRSLQLRASVPSPTLGFGLEAGLQRDLVAQIYGDLIFQGPAFLIGGALLFKPDLGQFDRDLRGIRPYLGGGLGLRLPNPDFALTLDAGDRVFPRPRYGSVHWGSEHFPLQWLIIGTRFAWGQFPLEG
jgi:hypothetical protein